jgi:hypothetical protein
LVFHIRTIRIANLEESREDDMMQNQDGKRTSGKKKKKKKIKTKWTRSNDTIIHLNKINPVNKKN